MPQSHRYSPRTELIKRPAGGLKRRYGRVEGDISSHHKAVYMAVVFVNRSYSTGTSGLHDAYPKSYGISAGHYEGGTFEPPPNFAKLAEAVNGYGEQVTELSQLALALKRGLEHTRNHIPAVIAVRVPGPMQGAWGREA